MEYVFVYVIILDIIMVEFMGRNFIRRCNVIIYSIFWMGIIGKPHHDLQLLNPGFQSDSGYQMQQAPNQQMQQVFGILLIKKHRNTIKKP